MPGRADGIWGIETEGPARGTSKHFYRAPVGAEMCGPFFTPDDESGCHGACAFGEIGDDGRFVLFTDGTRGAAVDNSAVRVTEL